MEKDIALAGEPLPQALDDLAADAGRGGPAGTPRWAVLSSEWAQTCRDALVVDASDLAGIDAARLALGCRLCRLKSGHYPGGLDELPEKLPGHFRNLPADPFSGRPFRYAKTGKGCRVWSLGENRADDGGHSRKDIVFELNR
jgi:hypothetical protein